MWHWLRAEDPPSLSQVSSHRVRPPTELFSDPVTPSPTPHLGYSFVLGQVPMGHKKTIVFIFILSHFIIIILRKGKRRMFIICGNNIRFI